MLLRSPSCLKFLLLSVAFLDSTQKRADRFAVGVADVFLMALSLSVFPPGLNLHHPMGGTAVFLAGIGRACFAAVSGQHLREGGRVKVNPSPAPSSATTDPPRVATSLP